MQTPFLRIIKKEYGCKWTLETSLVSIDLVVCEKRLKCVKLTEAEGCKVMTIPHMDLCFSWANRGAKLFFIL
jgi:hypothetical protein